MEKGLKTFFIMIFVFFLILCFTAIIINIYSKETAKPFCNDKGMKFYELSPINRRGYDLKDDVICYQIYNNNEIKFFYFER